MSEPKTVEEFAAVLRESMRKDRDYTLDGITDMLWKHMGCRQGATFDHTEHRHSMEYLARIRDRVEAFVKSVENDPQDDP